MCRHTVLSQTSCQYKKHLLNRPTWIFQIYVWEIDHELLVYFFVCKNKKAFQGYFSTCMTKENPSPLFTYLQISQTWYIGISIIIALIKRYPLIIIKINYNLLNFSSVGIWILPSCLIKSNICYQWCISLFCPVPDLPVIANQESFANQSLCFSVPRG